jgi:signal transduction histidine kinase
LEEFNVLEIFRPLNGMPSEVQITFESLRYIYGRLKFGIDPEDEEKFKTFMQLRLNLDLPSEPLKVKNSKFLMLSHVRNLLSNSIKHIRLQDLKDDPQGDTINLKIESCLDDNFINISVTDYGAGVRAEKLKELQRVFAQEAEGSRKDEPGEDSKKGRDLGSRIRRGRGLINMARELYRLKEYQAGGMKDQAKGGWVEVKNNESGRGATFTLFIPKLL